DRLLDGRRDRCYCRGRRRGRRRLDGRGRRPGDGGGVAARRRGVVARVVACVVGRRRRGVARVARVARRRRGRGGGCFVGGVGGGVVRGGAGGLGVDDDPDRAAIALDGRILLEGLQLGDGVLPVERAVLEVVADVLRCGGPCP